jgi:g-D-glutamyl-meso-diaminopimelate peptidase
MRVIDKVSLFYQNFKGEKEIIGKSLYGVPIYKMTVEKSGYPVLIVQGAMHAREHITALLTLKMIEDFIENGRRGTVHFIPLINPDGVSYCEEYNPLYKANGRGVDLNVNFPARWGKGEKNVNAPSNENYIGLYPLSEPESSALVSFTLKIKPNLTVSLHAKGEEIYWEFGQSGKRKKRDKFIAKKAAKATGYKLKLTKNSSGGYKDWCVQELKIPALTVEVGTYQLAHPIGSEYLDAIYEKNKRLINELIDALWEIKCNKNL